jgi:hypothetical protein
VAYFTTIAQVKANSVMPGADIDAIEAADPGWIVARAATVQSRIDSRLRKRYAAPFADPPPVVLGWLGAMLTVDLYLYRGVNPSDQQMVTIQAQADRAADEVKEAANAVDGLFDLPLSTTTTTTGIEEPATLHSSDASCFTFKHRQPAGSGSWS